MSVSLRTSAASAVRPARAVSVKCQAGPHKALPAALATFAAASLIATPAFAGVILQQPELKKVFQEDASSAPAKKSSSSAAASAPKAAPAPKAEAPKKVESYSEGGSFPNSLLLVPASIAAIVGGGFVLTKVDPGFEDTFTAAILKDSSTTGAGYEVALKEGGVAALKVGTTKVRSGTTKKGKK